ncbi:MAG: iron ABC transporter permease [Lentisphaerae bacterium RIFOXYA12_FULL_48_11]|nr:MAG: iron ABC transporter permease [Lentisphaerae bacterium RIFOXYA12_FULL_48_11]
MMQKRLVRNIIWLVVLCVISFGVGVIALCVGSGGIMLKDIPSILFSAGDSAAYSILIDIRLPRILLGFGVGGALSLAGVILQAMFRNPLVEPYTLGISGGAALGACLAIVLNLAALCGAWCLPVSGFLGACVVIMAVYFLAVRKHAMNTRDLLLAGVMISFICSSLVMLVMAVSRAEELHGIIFWIMGSLEEPDILLVRIALVVAVLSLAASYFFCLDLNALTLGEEEAAHLGVSVENTKRMLFLITCVATGFSVSVAGVIGFVGLVVPHVMRLSFGNDHRFLLVASWVGGGAFLVLCDTVARIIISPLELPVGVITGILGGGVFIYVVGRKPAMAGDR